MDATYQRQAWPVTRLYSDAKQAYRAAHPPVNVDDDPELQSLHRKFRIQKDRLIAWGFEWTDNANAQEGSIDESVERAGLTEVVSSVMENIKDILDRVDRLGMRPVTGPRVYGDEKSQPQLVRQQWTAEDREQYRDLINDMTMGVDLLCDLSKSRRASSEKNFAPGTPPLTTQDKAKAAMSLTRPDVPGGQAASYGLLKIDPAQISLPEESPPPYDDFGIPRPVRTIAHMSGFDGQELVAKQLPVLIEYVSFDGAYKNTTMPLPMDRLEILSSILCDSQALPTKSLPQLLGYFEDPERPRMGLVFHLPPSTASTIFAGGQAKQASLFDLLQAASQLHSNPGASASMVIPPLEDRFRLAMELVSGFSFLHDRHFPLRNISSNSVALMARSVSSTPRAATDLLYDVREPQICTFDLFSEYDVEASPDYLGMNIYRHPDDPRIRGSTSSEDYHIGFDLYSMGLVLLEIGLWLPLSDIFKEKYSLRDFKTRVEKIWTKRLAGKCGTAYMKAVQDCLKAGSQAAPTTDAIHSVYARTMARLQRCCMLDDEDDQARDEQSEAPSLSAQTSNIPRPTQAPAVARNTGPITRVPVGGSAVHARILKQTPEGPLMRYPFKKLPKEVYSIWKDGGLEDRVARLTDKVLKDNKDTFLIDLSYIGLSENSAKPTICVSCTKPKMVRAVLGKRLKYDPETFDLLVVRGRITRSKAGRTGARRSAGTNSDPDAALNAFHQQRPVCGASIGAWHNSEHLRPVSFGGVVLVDGEPYGMTVHHLIEDDEDDDEPAPKQSTTPMQLDTTDALSSIYEDDDNDDISDDDSHFDFDISDSELSDDEQEQDSNVDDFFAGNKGGIAPGQGDEITITQPALDDVPDDFFPSEEDRDDDHLDSHSLGHIYASSGIRRCTREGVEYEVDWALIKLDEHRLQPYNLVAGGTRYCHSSSPSRPTLKEPIFRQQYHPSEDCFPSQVAGSATLGGLDVHCFGRTSGLAGGRIEPDMRQVRFRGRSSRSSAWCVQADFGPAGDSGAWVFDNERGQVCGYVLAYLEPFGIALIAPMDVMLDDMRLTLGMRTICLPGPSNVANQSLTTAPVEETADIEAAAAGIDLDDDDNDDIILDCSPMTSHGQPSPAPRQEQQQQREQEEHRPSPAPATRPMSLPRTTATTTATSNIVRLSRGPIIQTRSSAAMPPASTRGHRGQAPHFLLTGNPTHLEREWASRRRALGTEMASG